MPLSAGDPGMVLTARWGCRGCLLILRSVVSPGRHESVGCPMPAGSSQRLDGLEMNEAAAHGSSRSRGCLWSTWLSGQYSRCYRWCWRFLGHEARECATFLAPNVATVGTRGGSANFGATAQLQGKGRAHKMPRFLADGLSSALGSDEWRHLTGRRLHKTTTCGSMDLLLHLQQWPRWGVPASLYSVSWAPA